MAAEPAGKKRTVDSDGVVRVKRERASVAPAFLVGALAVVGAGALFLAFHRGSSSTSPERAPPPRPVARRAPPPQPLPELPVPEPERAQPTRAATVPETPGRAQEADMPTDPPDEHHGIGLFHPGTKPIKVGIIVPDGFDLPPGYVRHYQTTDDGQMLPPILMFHPDHPPVDAQGRPLPVTADRIVPPELAPPGMPIQMLQPPKPSGDEGPQR